MPGSLDAMRLGSKCALHKLVTLKLIADSRNRILDAG
jgi:hypothetical protein